MEKYIYSAKDAQGHVHRGTHEAASEQAAREWLRSQGWLVLSLTVAGLDAAPPPLRIEEAEHVLMQVAELAESNVPIAEGLRAAAETTDSRRYARTFRRLADAVERGEELASALSRVGMPRYLRGVLAAAQRTGRAPQVLFEILEHHQSDRDVRRSMLRVLAYPLSLLAAAFLISAGVLLLIVPEFKEIFDEVQVNLPIATTLVFWWGDHGVWTLIGLMLIIVLALMATPLCVGIVFWQRLLLSLPLFGSLWQWSEAAKFSRLLGSLLACKVPLPEAVLLAGDAAADLNIDQACEQVAQRLELGSSLSSALSQVAVVPPPLIAYVRWGEQQQALPEALAAAGEMLEGRARLRSLAVVHCLPPLLFVLVLAVAVAAIAAILMPMIILTRGML